MTYQVEYFHIKGRIIEPISDNKIDNSKCNAVTYLYDFINNYLKLTEEEEENLKRMSLSVLGFQTLGNYKEEAKSLKEQGLKRCRVCGRVFLISEFWRNFGTCKSCYRKKCNDRYNNKYKNERKNNNG